jgi:hypothetical protein
MKAAPTAARPILWPVDRPATTRATSASIEAGTYRKAL